MMRSSWLMYYITCNRKSKNNWLKNASATSIRCEVVIIRDGDKDKEEQHKRTKLTEFFSTRVLNFNKTKETGLSFLSGKMIRSIAADRKMSYKEMADSRLTSNTIFILKMV